MKKTNVILGIVIAMFVICAVTVLVIAVINNTEKENIPVDIDFEALSSDIEESTNIDNNKMQQITIEDLQSDFNINPDWIVKVIGVKPYVNITSSMYVIVEVTDGNVDNVVSAFKEFGNKYDEMWKDYLTEEYELVKNRQIGSKGNYVYFVVSDYSKEIVDLIK
jgi:hypothetical protein